MVPTARLAVAPSIREAGPYLTSRLTFESHPGFHSGLVVGTGRSGFHFGAEGVWEVLVSGRWRGSLGLSAVFARKAGQGFFTAGGSASVSHPFHSGAGVLVPFAGLQVTPSFALGAGRFETGLRTGLGLSWELPDFGHAIVSLQWGQALANAQSEAILGVSYPFTLL